MEWLGPTMAPSSVPESVSSDAHCSMVIYMCLEYDVPKLKLCDRVIRIWCKANPHCPYLPWQVTTSWNNICRWNYSATNHTLEVTAVRDNALVVGNLLLRCQLHFPLQHARRMDLLTQFSNPSWRYHSNGDIRFSQIWYCTCCATTQFHGLVPLHNTKEMVHVSLFIGSLFQRCHIHDFT